MTKSYRGTRANGRCVVEVFDGKTWSQLSPDLSLTVRNHSPTGFEWGYTGSGPAQLALALLLDVTGDRATAEHHYQAFKASFVASWDCHGGFSVSAKTIQQWIA